MKPVMKFEPILRDAELFFELDRADFAAFREAVTGNNPPSWKPATHRVTEIIDTGYLPVSTGRLMAKVRLQHIGERTKK